MERYDFKTQRLFIDVTLSSGAKIELDRGQANYLLNVLRLKEGASVLVFNGRDGEWLCALKPSGRKSCGLVLEKQTRVQPEAYNLTYCFAPLKVGRLEYMVQKAVEMGAGILQPVITQHTQITKLNMDRVKANAMEAAEQCGILSIPVCKDPIKLPKLLEEWNPAQHLIFADESAEGINPINGLKKYSASEPKGLLIGPEGGFSEEERKQLFAQTFVHPISLGPRILRADTAAVAALTVIQGACGDW